MKGSVYVRLAVMMFIQYAVWGVWAPTLAAYLGGLESFRENTGFKIGMVYMTMAIASMLSPFVAGQLADRYFSTERFLAFSHLVGGILLFWAAQITSYDLMFWVMLGHCILYAPTVPLTNSLSFHHLPNGEKEFGAIRLWGTIGWIAVGWAFSGWLALPSSVTEALPAPPSVGDCLMVAAILSFVMAGFCLSLPHTPPSKKPENPWAFVGALKLARDPSFAVLLIVAFLVSTELQFYYVLTPNFFVDEPGLSLSQSQIQETTGLNKDDATVLMQVLDLNRNNKVSKAELKGFPERLKELRTAQEKITESVAPLRDIQKAVTELGSDERSAESIANYVLTAADRNQDKQLSRDELNEFVKKAEALEGKPALALARFDELAVDRGGLNLPNSLFIIAMSLGQVAEIVVLALLPLALARLGFGVTIAIGIAAWSIRYAIFALGQPVWLVVASQTLHGFGFGFFFVGCMIYSDRIAPKDVRASAQSLLIFVTFGAGMLISSLIAGPVADYFEFDWHKVFLVPVAITALCTVAFLIGFRETKAPVEMEKDAPVGAASN